MATIAPRPITRGRSVVGEVLFWLALAVAFIFFMFPLFWLLVTSLKQRSEVTLLPPTFVPFVDFQPTAINYLAEEHARSCPTIPRPRGDRPAHPGHRASPRYRWWLSPRAPQHHGRAPTAYSVLLGLTA